MSKSAIFPLNKLSDAIALIYCHFSKSETGSETHVCGSGFILEGNYMLGSAKLYDRILGFAGTNKAIEGMCLFMDSPSGLAVLHYVDHDRVRDICVFTILGKKHQGIPMNELEWGSDEAVMSPDDANSGEEGEEMDDEAKSPFF